MAKLFYLAGGGGGGERKKNANRVKERLGGHMYAAC